MRPFPWPIPNDRESLPHFAGRADEIAALNPRLDKVLAGSVAGGIVLVTGVPWASKSELGWQFVKGVTARESPPAICHLPADAL